MADLKRLAKLKDQVSTMQREADKAQGALDSILARLKKEFKCDDLEAAEKLLETIRADLEAAEEEYEKALARFERKWGDVLQ